MMWQVSFGVSALLVFVLVPTWAEYLASKREVHTRGNLADKGVSRAEMQELVYKKRMELRRKLDESSAGSTEN